MKTINKIYYVAFFTLMCLTSCELTRDLDEFDPLYSLPAETAISDESSAEIALAGMYSILHQNDAEGNPNHSILPSTLSGVNAGGYFVFLSAEDNAMIANNPPPDGPALTRIYTGQYVLVNRANWIINGVEKLTDDDFINNNRRLEIIGEAKAMRALGHFHLLRLFGEFYDTSSSYGVNVRLEPATDDVAQPRVSVQETYDVILNDLDDAIASAPYLRAKYFANKIFVKGLKAKVLLYMGDYAQAATVAKDVIDNSGPNFALTDTFEELFDHSGVATLSNTEALFDVYSDANQSEGLGLGNFWSIFTSVSNWFYDLPNTGTMTVNGQVINYDTARIPFMQTGAYAIPGLGNGNMKFLQRSGLQFETQYWLRMAEVYLIYAEADARSANGVSTDALEALNAIRIRAGATTTGNDGFETYPASITLDQFLQAVRIEKLVELASEQGEDWFDLIRYDYADGFGTGFQVSDQKPTAINSEKFIMPIPVASIEAGGGVIIQNPGYPN
ncbi:Starch-binding associating with outer membrane [Flaviramulus basaltis]|uniref:Starch-binding associating with outer membrane n=1 Tax=Flaviramulus basaltis TaxID=369401 RepID=A0A1K2ILF2_9FLAO|nr:RagB/SusD family nutrient uptake outer membrane protein [Flaviramulus basaltis]SFZ93090.1 Starch-binding associating with outer membrane [Flaviramulus basaltis]